MGHRRLLTVTATTALCLLGSGLPAAYAETAPSSSALVRVAKSSPWKGGMKRTFASRTTTTTPTSTAPAQVVTVVDPALSMAGEIATIVNTERAKAGLAPLSVSTCAQGFAVTWSTHMAATADFSHQSLTPIMTTCAARGAGENIAYGGTSAAQFMTMWMNSTGHRANILRASFTHIGVGVARSASGTWYATQDFLTR